MATEEEIRVGQRGDLFVLLRVRKTQQDLEVLDEFPLTKREAARVRTYLCAWLGHADEDDHAEVLGWKKPADRDPQALVDLTKAPAALPGPTGETVKV